MKTIDTLTTSAELLAMPGNGRRYELVKGELKEMSPSGSEHGVIVARLTWRLAQFVEANGLGVVFGAEGGFQIAHDPDTVRAPDIAFVRQERVDSIGIPQGFWPGAPDLAVEVLSPGDRVSEVDAKVEDWLAAGTRMVWVVHPKWRTVTVYRSPKTISILTDAEALDGQDVVAGFQCKVGEIFI